MRHRESGLVPILSRLRGEGKIGNFSGEANDVEVREPWLDHQNVRALLLVLEDLAPGVADVGRVVLVGGSVAEGGGRIRRVSERSVKPGGELGRVGDDRRLAQAVLASTCRSIIEDGATTSAPAAACEIAMALRSGKVDSLQTSSPFTTPQWP